MRALSLGMVLALAACASQQAQPQPRPLASAADPNALKPAPAATGSQPASSTSTVPAPRATQPLKIDTGRKFEVVDVYVDTRDPSGLRKVVPYLMRTDEWMILKVEWTTSTTRHYRFQRVASSGESLPTPDPLLPKKKST